MSVPEALLRAAQAGDQAACGQLVEENQGLIWSIVRRYARGNLELDDLYQLGCLGFLKAVQGFDLAFGTQFSTYAVPKIAGEIRRFLRDDSVNGGKLMGGKTGYTDEAGHCLASMAKINGKEYILVTAGWAQTDDTKYHISDAFRAYNQIAPEE